MVGGQSWGSQRHIKGLNVEPWLVKVAPSETEASRVYIDTSNAGSATMLI
jgi:hypothetical protein